LNGSRLAQKQIIKILHNLNLIQTKINLNQRAVKKLIKISVIITILVTNSTFAQFFGPDGTNWYYSKIFLVPNPILEDFIQISSSGDTTIQGISCNKLIVNTPLFCGDQQSVKYTYYSNDTVFFYEPTYDSFQVLYCMNANQGDSWDIRVPDLGDEDTISISINAIDLVTINGIELKRFNVTYTTHFDNISDFSYNSYIIERIGDIKYMFNLFPEWSYTCSEAIISGLRCYNEQNSGIYSTGISETCDFQSFVGISEVNQYQASIYPNPANEIIYFSTDDSQNVSYVIFDLQGHEVLQGNSTSQINITTLCPGSYIVRINENGTFKSAPLQVIR
jgi:hypothetical protein